MKRVLTVFVAALAMAALLVVMAAPAFADNKPVKRTGGGDFTGGSKPCKQSLQCVNHK